MALGRCFIVAYVEFFGEGSQFHPQGRFGRLLFRSLFVQWGMVLRVRSRSCSIASGTATHMYGIVCFSDPSEAGLPGNSGNLWDPSMQSESSSSIVNC